jgi:hypothetical protein
LKFFSPASIVCFLVELPEGWISFLSSPGSTLNFLVASLLIFGPTQPTPTNWDSKYLKLYFWLWFQCLLQITSSC